MNQREELRKREELRAELKNLYGGANKFLTNTEINTLVNKSNGQNHLNIKKEAYKQAYSKYYNHLFDDILYQAFMRMKSSPQCPTGVNSEPIRKAAERSIQKRFGTVTTQGAKSGAIIGGAIGGGVGRGINVVGRGAAAAAQGVVRTAGAIAQLCKTNPTHPECDNGNNQNRRQNGRPSRSTAGQPPARYANGNRRGGPKSRSRKGPNQN
jgi:hypothetical protein